jgi:hypothetical protein
VLARSKKKKWYKVLVFKDDVLTRKSHFPSYALAKRKALATRHPVLDAVVGKSYGVKPVKRRVVRKFDAIDLM